MVVLICGSRFWTDPGPIESALMALQYEIAIEGGGPLTVVEGEAPGADSIAAERADYHGIAVRRFPAEWNVHAPGWCHCKTKLAHCPAAGNRRNQRMLTEGQPDLVVAFHDDIATSKGTKDMVNRARRAGIRVRIVTH